jgi:hypothetical protein
MEFSLLNSVSQEKHFSPVYLKIEKPAGLLSDLTVERLIIDQTDERHAQKNAKNPAAFATGFGGAT